ncbi:hypothetical protein [Methylobacterium nodulans]|uniref:Uncharacterized protein n=1 Tax=Methylobacterium nodulans (strain LMG 21967 / CNCM I-2342 / ORS 2060) TaxID=460265 RepID=B8ISC8_METNO|nr:hypothetical protein [Methylobacterium nodulans]ACL58768.1 conserved hypothetical protein [Methylobacterium nodulans ORS 2060]
MRNRSFAVRKARKGWGVYCARTGEPVRVNGREQTGLPRETAAELATSLKILAYIQAEFDQRRASNPHTLH